MTLNSSQPGNKLARFRDDGGAVLIEFALVLPLLAIVFLGIFEYGMAWRDKATLSNALRGAARVGASSTDVSNNRFADLYALQAFNATMSGGTNRMTVNRLVVYKPETSNNSGDPADPLCLTRATASGGSGINDACNIYSGSQVTAAVASDFTAVCTGSTGTAFDRFWCPTDRKQRQSDPPDYVGYYARVTYKSITKVLPNTVVLTDRFVARIDPKVTS